MYPKTMRALVKTRPQEGLSLEEVPVPTLRTDAPEVLVRVTMTSICGSDLHLWKWDPWAQQVLKPPRIVGHEMAGIVEAVSPQVKRVQEGDFVSVETHFWCGKCKACRTGAPHLCRNLEILGVHRDGAFAEYVVLPEKNLWKNPPDLPVRWAPVQEPMGNAVYATLVTPLAGKTVSIFGAGPIGLMSCAVARAAGASRIFLVEPNPKRLELGKKMGATDLINPREVAPAEYILSETDGEGVDVFLEMSGAQQAYEEGFRSVRRGGIASLLGIAPDAIRLDINEAVVLRGVTVFGIHGRKIYETWETVSALLESGAVNLDPIITHEFGLSEYEEAFSTLLEGRGVKVLLRPDA